MLELFSAWSVLLLCVSLIFVFFRRSRSGAEKFSNQSSSADSDKYLPAQLGEDEGTVDSLKASSDAKNRRRFDERQVSKERDVEEESESLRRRVSGRKTDERRGRKDRDNDSRSSNSKDEQIGSSIEHDASRQSPSGGDRSQQEIATGAEEASSKSKLQSGEEKEAIDIEGETICKTNNAETADSSSSKEHDTANNIKDYRQQTSTKVPKIVLSEAVDECRDEEENIQEVRNVNSVYDNIETAAVSDSSKESNTTGGIVVEEMVVKIENEVSEELPSEETVPEERECILEEEPAVDNNYGVEKPSEFGIVEMFSDKLSKSVCDAVLQDTQLLHRSGKDVENDSEKTLLKFSSVLAESIVKTVLNYSKINQEKAVDSDENCNLPTHVELHVAQNKTVNSLQESESVPVPINDEDMDSNEETADDASYRSLDEYAKQLAEQILNGVYQLNGQYNESAKSSSTDVYVTKLTESVLSHAINGAKSHMEENTSDSATGIQEGLLDMFIDEIVQNVLHDAISRVVVEDPEEHIGHNAISRMVIEDQEEHIGHNGVSRVIVGDQEEHMSHNAILRVVVEDQEEHVGNQEERGCLQNGYIGEASGQNGAEVGRVNNGKLQSKWLSEDDLDELYEDDLSDEEVNDTSENLTTPDNLADNKGPEDSSNKLNVPNNNLTQKEQTAFWRRSLIEDLDDEFEFEDFESQHSSSPASLTRSANFEVNALLPGGSLEDEEVNDSVPAVKAPVVPKTTSSQSSRSRLRSVDSTPVLVFDNGSAFLKVGFSNGNVPKEIVPSVVGMPLRYSQDISGMEYSYRPGLVFGGEAVGKAGVLHIDYPMKSGVIEKWNDVEGMWNYVLGSLMGIQDHPDFPVLISQPALNSKKNTEKLAEIMFEHFHMPSLFIASQPVLSLFSMGLTSGLSFCSGFSSTQASVVYEGHILPHTVKQLDIAGYQLTETLRKLLMSGQGFGFRSSSQWQIVNDIKEKMAFVSQDFSSDAKRYKTQAELQTPYELPDGQVIEVGLERFGCAETLFRPMELGLTQPPAHVLITEAINSCDEELQEMCYKSMGISGGTTLMSGFVTRLERELKECDRKFKNFTIPEHRELSTWLGGSVVASLPTFREMVVTVDEYADAGARVIHSKCF